MFPLKKWSGGLVWGVWPIRVFLNFCIFFNLTRSLNVLVTSSRFIWIPMSWVNYHYDVYTSLSAGTDYLTSMDVRFWRIKTVPTLKELTPHVPPPGYIYLLIRSQPPDVALVVSIPKINQKTSFPRVTLEITSAARTIFISYFFFIPTCYFWAPGLFQTLKCYVKK